MLLIVLNDDNVGANYIVPEREREVQSPSPFYSPHLTPLCLSSGHCDFTCRSNPGTIYNNCNFRRYYQCLALQRVWLNGLNIRREHLQQKLKICATRPCQKRSLFCWLACSGEQEESVLLNKTSSPSFLGLSLVFTLVRFLHFTPKNETCFLLLNHVSCHEKYKRNDHVTNCQIVLNNTIHCFVIVITIMRIPEINRDYLPTKLGVKQWVQILFNWAYFTASYVKISGITRYGQ